MNEASPEIGGIETDIEYDISGFLDGIEGTLSKQYAYAPCWNRPVAGNKFKEGFEAVFGISVEDIDGVEEQLTNIENADLRENKIQLYHDLVEKIKQMYDTYLGITFDEQPTTIIDMNKLYMVYRTIYVNFTKFIRDCVIGRCTKENIPFKDEDGNIFNSVIQQTVGDENVFTDENIREWLFIADPGNIEYEYVFGKFIPNIDDETDASGIDGLTEVCINNDAFRKYINSEFRYAVANFGLVNYNDIFNHN